MDQIPSIFLFSAGAAIIAVAGFSVVHRVVKPIDLEEHKGFLDAMLSIVGTLVSILLGLLVAAALTGYQSVEQSVDSEAASVSEIYRLSLGLPQESKRKIQDLCVRYCNQVLTDEWPAMAQGHQSHKVLVTAALLIGEIATLHPQNNGESNIHAALITAMQQMGDCRRQRLLAMHSAWTRHLMPVLLMCSAIVLAFAYLYVRRGAVLHGVLICLVAMALGGNLGLVFLLTNPFNGDWKIQPRGFELNNEILKMLHDSPELKNSFPNERITTTTKNTK